MIIEKHKLSELKPASYNPRQISKDELKKLENSIERWENLTQQEAVKL